MKGVAKESSFRLVEKKSVFVGIVCPIVSEDQFDKKLQEIRLKYQDATHVTFAVCCKSFCKESDAKEPAHVAGSAILAEIKKANLDQVAIFVVRYFGGTKLGKAGLKKAYQNCAKGAIDEAALGEIVEIFECKTDVVAAQKASKKLESLGANIKYGSNQAIICFEKSKAPSKEFLSEILGTNVSICEKEVIACQ